MGTGRKRTLSPASLFIFAVRGSLPPAHLGVHGSSSCFQLWLQVPVEPGGAGRSGPLGPSCGHTGAVCPAGRDWGKAATLQFALEAGPGHLSHPSLAHLAWCGGTEWPRVVKEPQGRGLSSLCGLPRSLAWGQWPVPFPPEQGSAGDSCSPGGRAPALAVFPHCCPALQQGWSSRSHFSAPGLESLCRWGEETREHNSSSPRNKSHVYIRQLLARWHKRPWCSMTPGNSRFTRPAPLQLPGGDSQ